MARAPQAAILSSAEPCAAVPTVVTIGHVQLRDVVVCPHEKGIVSYAQGTAVVEHDLIVPSSTPRHLVDLSFVPNTVSALVLPEGGDTILAAGGQDAELHISYFRGSASSSRYGSRGFGNKVWETKYNMEHNSSINNSVNLTTLNLGGSHESSAEPRIVVSNNDRTVKVFDIAIRNGASDDFDPRLVDVGNLRLDVPVNHSSISPDGRTLLCVGDSPDVYMHRISGGGRLTFTPIETLSLSAHISHELGVYPASSVPASFSTAFSADGSKFAVASQEGVVVVWDVRSTKPLKVFRTDKTRAPSAANARGWLYDVPWDWARGGARAPGWGVRSVKFSPAAGGREVMTFTEHTSLFHVVDARTFETEEIVRVPTFEQPPPPTAPPIRRSSSPAVRPPPVPIASSSSSTQWGPPAPPRIVLFSGALEDTFRIPAGSHRHAHPRPRPPLRARGAPPSSSDDDDGYDSDGLVVIPRLGDREVENNVRRLLGRRAARVEDRDAPHEDDMDVDVDVDELESDCLSSRAPSPTPAPPQPLPQQPQQQQPPQQQPAGTRPLELLRARSAGLLARRESSGPYVARRAGISRRHRRGGAGCEAPEGAAAAEDEQDLAGTCFDPSGTFLYVASVRGVAEWRVRGAEQRWWTAPEWA